MATLPNLSNFKYIPPKIAGAKVVPSTGSLYPGAQQLKSLTKNAPPKPQKVIETIIFENMAEGTNGGCTKCKAFKVLSEQKRCSYREMKSDRCMWLVFDQYCTNTKAQDALKANAFGI